MEPAAGRDRGRVGRLAAERHMLAWRSKIQM
jgi:hypothetical protein